MIIAGLIAVIIFAFINAAPLALAVTLFAGNIGFEQFGFWEFLPGAFAVLIAKNGGVLKLPETKVK